MKGSTHAEPILFVCFLVLNHYSVASVENGSEAAALLQELDYDLVVVNAFL